MTNIHIYTYIFIYIYYLYQRIRECSPRIIPWGEKGRPTPSSLLTGPPTMPGSGGDSLGNEHVTLFSDEKNGGYVRRFNFQSLRLQFDDALGEYLGIIIKLFETMAFFFAEVRQGHIHLDPSGLRSTVPFSDKLQCQRTNIELIFLLFNHPFSAWQKQSPRNPWKSLRNP